MLFKPDFWLKNVLSIDKQFLNRNRIDGLVLDLDNTLSMHGSPAAENGIFEWLEEMRSLGIKLVVASNNTEKRVRPLAEKLGVPFVSFACKPLCFGINKAIKLTGLSRKKICLVGDQIFTDVLGGNSCGVRTILVEPFHLEDTLTFKLKRKAEGLFFNRDYSKLERK